MHYKRNLNETKLIKKTCFLFNNQYLNVKTVLTFLIKTISMLSEVNFCKYPQQVITFTFSSLHHPIVFLLLVSIKLPYFKLHILNSS